MFSDLYNTDILALASTLENTSLPSPRTTARKVSKLCGEIIIKDYLVREFALRVQACALGQASAAILKEGILGCSLTDTIKARDALRAMLKEGAPPPDGQFEKLALLKGVANYPARHASTLLAFEAAVAAFENAGIRLP